jgi:hypothetical protein
MRTAMKITSLALVTLFSIISSSYAQEVGLGVKGGLNASNISNFDGDNRVSGHLGVFANIKVNHSWAFQPELLYSGEGQRYMDGGDQYTLALNYIDIPLLIQYYPVHNVYLEFGPQIGFLVSARDKGPDGYNHGVTSDYNKTEAKLDLGVGIHATHNVGFYLRYGVGLSDITPGDNYRYTNDVFQLGLSYRLQ